MSYIDAEGVEHIKEHLTLEWDFVIQTPFEKGFLDAFKSDLPKFDAWENRRYELVRTLAVEKDAPLDDAIARADEIIARLNPEGELASERLLYDPNKGL